MATDLLELELLDVGPSYEGLGDRIWNVKMPLRSIPLLPLNYPQPGPLPTTLYLSFTSLTDLSTMIEVLWSAVTLS